jgi:hypothetical protein
MITRKSAPDALDAPRDLRPPRSRTAGPRAGRGAGSELAVVVVVGAAVTTGAAADGAGADASTGPPCAQLLAGITTSTTATTYVQTTCDHRTTPAA